MFDDAQEQMLTKCSNFWCDKMQHKASQIHRHILTISWWEIFLLPPHLLNIKINRLHDAQQVTSNVITAWSRQKQHRQSIAIYNTWKLFSYTSIKLYCCFLVQFLPTQCAESFKGTREILIAHGMRMDHNWNSRIPEQVFEIILTSSVVSDLWRISEFQVQHRLSTFQFFYYLLSNFKFQLKNTVQF